METQVMEVGDVKIDVTGAEVKVFTEDTDQYSLTATEYWKNGEIIKRDVAVSIKTEPIIGQLGG